MYEFCKCYYTNYVEITTKNHSSNFVEIMHDIATQDIVST